MLRSTTSCQIFLLILLLIDIQVFCQNKYALVIGISGYPNFEEKDQLEFADDDAKEFASFIKTDAGGNFPKDNVELITNQNATRIGITNGIQWLKMRSNSNDLIYVFFAGHGLVSDAGQAYFMPYEGNQNNPTAMGFRADRFLEDIQTQINYKHLIFFSDACHAGAIYSHGVVSRDGNENIVPEMDRIWKDLFKGKEEITMAFLSAASNQRSHEDPEIRNGLFTYYLIEGLKGSADGAYNEQKDNTITAIELYSYLLKNVENHAKRLGKKQTPTKSPTFIPDFPFAITTESSDPATRTPNFEDAYAYNLKGGELYEDNKYFEAITMYEKAIEINQYYAEPYLFAGICYFEIGNCDKAFEYAKLANKYDTTWFAPYHSLGFLYAECYPIDLIKAYNHTLKAHEISPSNLMTMNNLGVQSFSAGKYQYSIEISEKIRETLKKQYGNEDRFYFRDDFNKQNKQIFLTSYFHDALNYLALNDKSNFEISYNNLIMLYNNYPFILSGFSYESAKHYVIESTSFKNYEKQLVIQLCNFLTNEKTRDVIAEYNLSIPIQYSHLEKPIYSSE